MFALQWKPEVSIGDISTALSFLTAFVGLVFAAVQLRRSIVVQRARFLLDATERYFGDTDVRRLYYDIDYCRFRLEFVDGEPANVQRGDQPPKPFIGSDEERLLDTLLYTFDVIGRIAESGALHGKEARLFAFQAERVFHNSEILRLLAWLDNERRRFGGELPTHRAARKLVERVSSRSKAR
jgi:hypothetical protein